MAGEYIKPEDNRAASEAKVLVSRSTSIVRELARERTAPSKKSPRYGMVIRKVLM